MKKKSLTYLSILCLCFTLTACGGKEGTAAPTPSSNESDIIHEDNTDIYDDKATDESEYSIKEILEQEPEDQLRLLIEKSIVPETEADASEKLTNRICEKTSYKFVSEDTTGVTFEVTYPDVSDSFVKCYNDATDDTSMEDIYNSVEELVSADKCPYKTETITLIYADDNVALIYNNQIVNALTGGLYNMFMEGASNE